MVKLTFKTQREKEVLDITDHILSSLIGTSLTLPVENGQLVLGTWQRIVLIEFDGPRERELVIQYI